MTSPNPLLHLPRGVINRAKCDVFTPSSFGRVKAHVRRCTLTDRVALYTLDKSALSVPSRGSPPVMSKLTISVSQPSQLNPINSCENTNKKVSVFLIVKSCSNTKLLFFETQSIKKTQ